MSSESWNQRITKIPHAHVLQTNEWAEVKSEVGWVSHELTWEDDSERLVGAAKVLVRKVKPFRIGPSASVAYVPRGPMLDWTDQVLVQRVIQDLQDFARRAGAIFLKIDPEVTLGTGIPGSKNASEDLEGRFFCDHLLKSGWRPSSEQVQFKNTALLDLTGDEESWLARMKQKARYNLRLAQRSGIIIRIAKEEDLQSLYRMYAQTAARDGFIIREESYYIGVWERFSRAGMAHALIAEVEGQPVAGLVLFHFGKRAWYLYGMSTNLHREKMPNYLLQWEAMRLAKSLGCEIYDLWGAPDEFESSDPMFGVFRFKEGLGATVLRTPGAWDYPVKPFLYFLYQQVLPRLLNFTRFIRKKRIQQETRGSV